MRSFDGPWFLLTLFFLALVLTGFVETNVTRADFTRREPLASIESLAGTYRNRGETSDGRPTPTMLSRLLWPNDANLSHEQVETIAVEILDGRTLRVTARERLGPRKIGEYAMGRNFRWEQGRLGLHSRLGIAGMRSCDPKLASEKEEVVLGLDCDGQGKDRPTAGWNSLVLLDSPMPRGATQDVRFLKFP